MQITGSGANLIARDSVPKMRSLSSMASSIVSSMVSLMILAVVIASPFAAMPAAAQPRPPKPYAPVAITRPAPSGDESFIAFRAALAAAAKTRIYAELSALMLTQGFFWDRDFARRFDPRKPAVDNLALAVALTTAGTQAGAVLVADGKLGDVLGDAETRHQGAAGPAQIVQAEIDTCGLLQLCDQLGPALDAAAGDR